MKTKQWFIGIAVFLLIGCAPVISENVLKSVDKNVTYRALSRNPDQYKGKIVLLGGSILETIPTANKTVITILQYPLASDNRPEVTSPSQGRFLVEVEGFLDPAIYRAGRWITVAGAATGKETRKLGQINYTYPVLNSKELYLWPLSGQDSGPRFHIGVGVGTGF